MEEWKIGKLEKFYHGGTEGTKKSELRKRRMEKWKTATGHYFTANWLLPTGYCQLATADWLLPTADFPFRFALCLIEN